LLLLLLDRSGYELQSILNEDLELASQDLAVNSADGFMMILSNGLN